MMLKGEDSLLCRGRTNYDLIEMNLFHEEAWREPAQNYGTSEAN